MSNIHDIIWAYQSVCKAEGNSTNAFIMKTFEAERSIILQLEKERQRAQSNKDISFDPDEPVKQAMFLRLCGNNHLITDTRLVDDDVLMLMRAFLKAKNTYITRVDLRYNNITDTGAKIIGEYLQTNPCLKEIDLMCNDIGEEGAQLLAKALQINENLLMLKLNGNKIGSKGGLNLAGMLQVNSTLIHLDVGDTDQKTESMIAMATVLNFNNTLKGLNLNRSLLFSQQEETTVHFSKMLKVNRGLVELHLRKADIKDFGATRLAECLKDNMTLQYLDLGCNGITRDGAKKLAELLKVNSALRILDLHANRIEDDGAQWFADGLATLNCTLHTIGLTNNNIGSDGLCELAKCLRMNSTITNIYIWGNHFEDECCKEFGDLVESERLDPTNMDVMPYEVDGVSYFSQQSKTIEEFYYWEPFYGRHLPVRDDIELRYAGM